MVLNVALVFLVFVGVNCDIEFPEEQYCPVVNRCRTPLLYNVKYRCAVDRMCLKGYKCCRSDCYIHKVCVIAVNKNGDKIELPDVSTKTTTTVPNVTEKFSDLVEELNKNTTSDTTLSNDFDYSTNTPWGGPNTEITDEVVTQSSMYTTEALSEETTSFTTEVTESFNITTTLLDEIGYYFTNNLTEFSTKMAEEESNTTETTFYTEKMNELSTISNEETATTTEVPSVENASFTEDVTESFTTHVSVTDNTTWFIDHEVSTTIATTEPPTTATESSEWTTASTIFTDESTDDIIIFPNDYRLSTTKKNTEAITTEKYGDIVEGSGNSYTDDDEEVSGANQFTPTSRFNVVTDDEFGIDGSGSGYGPDTDDSVFVFPDDDYLTSKSQMSAIDGDFSFDINSSTKSVATKINEISTDEFENTKYTDFSTEKQSTVEEGSGSGFIDGSGDDSEPGDVDEEVGTYSSQDVSKVETTTGVYTKEGDVNYSTSTHVIVTGTSSRYEIDLIDLDSDNSFSSVTELPKTESPIETIEGSGNDLTDTENGDVDEEVGTDSSDYITKVKTTTSSTSTETIFTYYPSESDMIDLDLGNNTSSVTELPKTEGSIETIEGSGNELTDTEHGDVDEEITTFESTDTKKSNLVTTDVTATEDEDDDEEEEDDDDGVDEDIRNNFQHRIIRG